MSDFLVRLKELRHLINRYNWEYFTLNSPSISDEKFDQLFEELKRLEQAHPELADLSSPIHTVGSDLLQNFPEEKHALPLLSLNKVYNSDDLIKWMDKIPSDFCVEQKMDGVSLVLHYEQGVLIKALTRGDGKMGSLITENVRTISNIPLELPQPVSVIVRGEVYLKKADFHCLNAQQEVKFANPRNFTAGTLRRQKSSEVARVPLQFMAYDGFWQGDVSIKSHRESLRRLAGLRLPVSHEIGFFGHSESPVFPEEEFIGWIVGDQNPKATNWADLKAFLGREHDRREDLDYEIDGIVIKVNDLKIREEMGNTAHHPRWAMALKFGFQEGETRVKDIFIQIGRTGRVTPLAIVDPVEIAGATITRVTLHNQAYVDELGLKKGDGVMVSRRGDVIPAVESVRESVVGDVWQMPENCPECGFKLDIVGAHHFCSNRDCPARLKAQLCFFAGRKQMDIGTLSQKTIEVLFDQGFIKGEADLYSLDSAKIEQLEGMGKRKVEQLQVSLKKSLEQPFERVMVSLGLREIGLSVISLLEQAGYRSFDEYVELAKDPQAKEKLMSIKGVGEKLADSFCQQILSPSLLEKVEALKKIGLHFKVVREEKIEMGIFSGQVWCVTGSFEHFGNREQVHALIREQGGKVITRITKELTHLLVAQKAGSKRGEAEKLGIPCVSEEEFLLILDKAQKSS